MKKIISLIIALMMLLSAFAMAEGKEIIIGNITLSDNAGTNIDFSGIELKLAAADKGDQAGVSIAAAASGQDVLRAVLSADANGLYLSADGISDVYSISVETIEMLLSQYTEQLSGVQESVEQLPQMATEAAEKLVGIVMGSITEAGTQEVSGKVYQAYNVEVSHEQMKEILGVLDEFIALYPEIMAETGYSSFVEMLESEDVETSLDGVLLMNDDGMMLDLYGYADGEAVINEFVSIENVYREEAGLNAMDIYFALYDPSVEDTDESELGYAFLTIYTDPTTGDFAMVDLSIGEGGDAEEGIYIALNLDGGEDMDGFKYFTISTMDSSAEIIYIWGEDEMGFTAMLEITDVNEDIAVEAIYVMPEDGKGGFELTAKAGADEFSASADITIADTDGAWLPVIGETVDIMSVDDAQLEKLGMEAMGVLGKVISACSAASEDFAALISEVM